MKQEKTNSRRNFLSTIAILTSGTALAGSPLSLFDNGSTKTSLKNSWSLLLGNYGAKSFFKIGGTALEHNLQAMPGQVSKMGEVVRFEKEALIAQPTWVYWGNNNVQPDDVVISFFDQAYPYKKIKSINRFELQALVQLSTKDDLLHAICHKPDDRSKKRLDVRTRIAKRKTVQDVSLLANNDIIIKQQFFYNV